MAASNSWALSAASSSRSDVAVGGSSAQTAAMRSIQQCSTVLHLCCCGFMTVPGAANLQQLHFYTTLHVNTGLQTGDNAQQLSESCACNPVGRCQYEVAKLTGSQITDRQAHHW